jgi:hypothetical protein
MKVYGPYLRKDGRKHVIIYEHPNIRKTVSYPKYLMEQHLGRTLNENETVDHINCDYTDDRIENLQVLIRSEHAKLDVNRSKIVTLPCVYCGVPTEIHHTRHNRMIKQKRASPFCSRQCTGLYGAMIQNGKLSKYVADETLPVKYWKLKEV